MKILNGEDQLSTHDNTKIHEAVSLSLLNSLSLLKGSLSSKSYTCHYATSGSDNSSSYLIILNVIYIYSLIMT